MNRIKKVFLVVFITILVLVALNFVFKNTINLHGLTKDFKDSIEETAGVKIVESQGVYGKLLGNGNGIQYFVAVLIKEESVEDIDALIMQLDEQFDVVDYWEQKSPDIETKYLDRAKLRYRTDVSENSNYYTICLFTSHPNSNLLDLKGH